MLSATITSQTIARASTTAEAADTVADRFKANAGAAHNAQPEPHDAQDNHDHDSELVTPSPSSASAERRAKPVELCVCFRVL